jgi:hypothetical protein
MIYMRRYRVPLSYPGFDGDFDLPYFGGVGF